MYIRITEDAQQYPYDLRNLAVDYPNTSFPADPSEEVLAEFGVFKVRQATEYPEYDVSDVVVEVAPQYVLGEYVQSFEVRAMTDAEAEANSVAALAHAKIARAEAVRNIIVTTSTGKSFDGHEDAQNRISRSIQLMTDEDELPWVLADSTVALVTKAELAEALRRSGLAMAEIWVSIYK